MRTQAWMLPGGHEFCANTLFWETENIAILDPTGWGVYDTVHSIARAPPTNNLAKWSATDQGDYIKLLRLWKLRIAPKNFAVERATWVFVTSELERAAIMDPDYFRRSVTKFFEHYASRANAFKAQMETDLGRDFVNAYINWSPNQTAVQG